jgi:hypothetical protein
VFGLLEEMDVIPAENIQLGLSVDVSQLVLNQIIAQQAHFKE